MLTISGAEARCPICGSPDVTPVGRDFDMPGLEFLQCVCGQGWRLDSFLARQSEAPTLRRVRATDPGPSQAAAELPFDGRLVQVTAALRALGTADADQVTDWICERHEEIQRSATSKRLGELVKLGHAAEDGTHLNHRNRSVTLYRLTEQARRQAA